MAKARLLGGGGSFVSGSGVLLQLLLIHSSYLRFARSMRSVVRTGDEFPCCELELVEGISIGFTRIVSTGLLDVAIVDLLDELEATKACEDRAKRIMMIEKCHNNSGATECVWFLRCMVGTRMVDSGVVSRIKASLCDRDCYDVTTQSTD